MYCRTKAKADDIKRQQVRNYQELRSVFTHDYNKKQRPKFGSQKPQKSNQNLRYGNQNKQKTFTKMASTLMGADIQIESFIQIDQLTLGPTDQTAVNQLSITLTPNMKSLILNTTETPHRALT